MNFADELKELKKEIKRALTHLCDVVIKEAERIETITKSIDQTCAEPLIVKSGQTWVAHWEGVDYLHILSGNFDKFKSPEDAWDHFRRFTVMSTAFTDRWKSFTGPDPDIKELTDEIAHFHPVIIKDDNLKEIYNLWGVGIQSNHDFNMANIEEYPEGSLRWIETDRLRLLTAAEIKRVEK